MEQTLSGDDFSCISTKYGYLIYYRGYFIAGSIPLPPQDIKKLRGGAVVKRVKENYDIGVLRMRRILSGEMTVHERKDIFEINEKYKTGEYPNGKEENF